MSHFQHAPHEKTRLSHTEHAKTPAHNFQTTNINHLRSGFPCVRIIDSWFTILVGRQLVYNNSVTREKLLQ